MDRQRSGWAIVWAALALAAVLAFCQACSFHWDDGGGQTTDTILGCPANPCQATQPEAKP